MTCHSLNGFTFPSRLDLSHLPFRPVTSVFYPALESASLGLLACIDLTYKSLKARAKLPGVTCKSNTVNCIFVTCKISTVTCKPVVINCKRVSCKRVGLTCKIRGTWECLYQKHHFQQAENINKRVTPLKALPVSVLAIDLV